MKWHTSLMIIILTPVPKWQLSALEIISEEQEYEPITLRNIREVLEFNKVPSNLYNLYDYDYLELVKDPCDIDFRNPRWLQHIEVEFGKLNPLPKKQKFDFEQYLLDNGFEKLIPRGLHKFTSYESNDIYVHVYEEFITVTDTYLIKTKENADKLIAASKKLDELEKI